MANKKRKQETQIMEEIKGLPYGNLARKIIDYAVLAFGIICILSLVIPVVRFWYPLSSNPTYTNFFTPGYAFIFGGKIKDVGTETSTRVLTVKFNVRYLIAYVSILLSCASIGLCYTKKFKGDKKFLRLISSIGFAVAFILIFNYNSTLVTILRGYSNVSNTIKEGAFTFYGWIFIVSLAVGSITMLYQACCEKIVKN